jgi:hypothetical protein
VRIIHNTYIHTPCGQSCACFNAKAGGTCFKGLKLQHEASDSLWLQERKCRTSWLVIEYKYSENKFPSYCKIVTVFETSSVWRASPDNGKEESCTTRREEVPHDDKIKIHFRLDYIWLLAFCHKNSKSQFKIKMCSFTSCFNLLYKCRINVSASSRKVVTKIFWRWRKLHKDYL